MLLSYTQVEIEAVGGTAIGRVHLAAAVGTRLHGYPGNAKTGTGIGIARSLRSGRPMSRYFCRLYQSQSYQCGIRPQRNFSFGISLICILPTPGLVWTVLKPSMLRFSMYFSGYKNWWVSRCDVTLTLALVTGSRGAFLLETNFGPTYGALW